MRKMECKLKVGDALLIKVERPLHLPYLPKTKWQVVIVDKAKNGIPGGLLAL